MATARPHVALIAFPFGTHAAPLFALARAIAAAAPGTAVSFLSTARSFATLSLAEESKNLLLVPVADGLPDAFQAPAALPPPEHIEQMIGMFMAAAAAGSLREALTAAETGNGGVRVSCVMSDAFLWMAGEVAEAVGKPWVPLWTGGPAGLSAHLYTDLLRSADGIGDGETNWRNEKLLDCVPVLGAHRVSDLPEGIVFGDLDAPVSRLLHRMAQTLPKAAAVLLNTFEGLDPAIESDFAAKFSKSLSLGPLHLLAPPFVPTPRTDHCLLWLDGRAPATVAYVSFGSFMSPPPAELAELAEGLEASGVEFLWSLKDEAKKFLPPGFLERTRDKGLVVSWAPQVEVLQHAAVGVFVMHGGWNSVLESITAGVPMISRPFFGDQRMNARSVSHVWEVGVVVEGGAMTKDGVVRALEVVLKREEGRRMREKASKLKAAGMRAVVRPEGSSKVNFKKFLEILG
ncbi:hypothetical protein Cni_G17346 [Canna indica]|uniref:Glycosyltransferase n=1 Tax=Canna indica TaxID=4628 RepID=A0AAQ3QGN8_9LILI|nr:hypothetical protein Cni_G17346 [Canna indica]